MAKVMLEIGEEAYRALMFAYEQYRHRFKNLDDFIIDLVDNYLMTDPGYIARVVNNLVKKLGRNRRVKVVVYPFFKD